MYAVPSLDEGIAWAEQVFGVTPVYGGAHQGLGTRNALLSLEDCYLEIIAPDPDQPLEGTNGEKMAALTAGGLVTWAAEGDLQRAKSRLQQLGIDAHGPVETQRRQENGEVLEWELLFPRSGLFGIPFFIDWKACINPARTSPVAGTLKGFEIRAPEEYRSRVQELLMGVDLDVEVADGEAELKVGIETSTDAIVELNTSDETRSLLVN